MGQISDSTIIEKLRDQGTRSEAFTIIVNEYKEQLYWLIRRMVLNHDDADDVLQNTFVKAWMALDQFRGDSKISSWLYRIATNEALSFLERKKISNISMDDATNVATTLMCDPYFDGDETAAQLQEAISTLPEKQRLVFNMKYFQEMKYEDMSDILGTSVGALKASYHHAVKKISDFFNKID